MGGDHHTRALGMKPVGGVALFMTEKLETSYKRPRQGRAVLVARFAALEEGAVHYNMAAATEDEEEAAVHPSLHPTAIPGNRIPQIHALTSYWLGPGRASGLCHWLKTIRCSFHLTYGLPRTVMTVGHSQL